MTYLFGSSFCATAFRTLQGGGGSGPTNIANSNRKCTMFLIGSSLMRELVLKMSSNLTTISYVPGKHVSAHSLIQYLQNKLNMMPRTNDSNPHVPDTLYAQKYSNDTTSTTSQKNIQTQVYKKQALDETRKVKR